MFITAIQAGAQFNDTYQKASRGCIIARLGCRKWKIRLSKDWILHINNESPLKSRDFRCIIINVCLCAVTKASIQFYFSSVRVFKFSARVFKITQGYSNRWKCRRMAFFGTILRSYTSSHKRCQCVNPPNRLCRFTWKWERSLALAAECNYEICLI